MSKLGRLVRYATPEELKIAEDIVREQEQFIVYTNLSRRLEGKTSSLSERKQNPNDTFKRHGLNWMIALAKVELGAMLAGFTSHTKPFQVIPPTRYEIHAYREILLDGLRTHYWALKKDPVIRNYRKTGLPDNQLLAYNRRMNVASQFFFAVQDVGFPQPQLIQLPDIKVIAATLNVHSLTLMFMLSRELGQMETRTISSSVIGASCALRAAQPELQQMGIGSQRVTSAVGTPKLADYLALLDPTMVTIPRRSSQRSTVQANSRSQTLRNRLRNRSRIKRK